MVHLLRLEEEPRPALLADELVPARREDELFEPRLKGILRRHVVERCLYGVDLDPLAVELCRLSLWIETLDPDLPFSFLDHKIKIGNSLVGCWFDQVAHYPAMAWSREGGDSGHSNGVHFEKDARAQAIKKFRGSLKDSDAGTVRFDLARFMSGRTLFDQDRLEAAVAAYEDARTTLRALHDLPVQDTEERARRYRELTGSEAWRTMKASFDLWCACWFWPADRLDAAPLASTFGAPRAATREIARELAREKRFFHWELEFPDVFDRQGSGFDAVVGNPPWDIAKPNSREFFSNHDPLYRAYGKQEALSRQTAYFEQAGVETAWLDYCADFKAQSAFFKYCAEPWGDPEASDKSGDRFTLARGKANGDLHGRWREARRHTQGYADAEHPFRHQGSADVNLYKLFLEQGHALLASSGRLGILVPSGLYSDHGTGALRQLFLDRCQWEWLFGFENREKIFDIHRSFKFNPVIVEKGGATQSIRTAFMRRKLEDWEEAEGLATSYTRERVTRFSPRSRAILEIGSERDLEILEKIYANSVLLGDQGPEGWGIKYAREFDMTNDSKLFPPRPWWEAQGHKPDEYSRWLKGDWQPRTRLCPAPPGCKRVEIPEGVILSRDEEEWIREDEIADTALPLYEGRMIGHFDFSQKGWLRGKGRKAIWQELPFSNKIVQPQYLMATNDYAAAIDRAELPGTPQGSKLVFMGVGSASNERTMTASVIGDRPAGNGVPVLATTQDPWSLLPFLCSLSHDFAARARCAGLNLNYFVIEESPLPSPRQVREVFRALALRLGAVASSFSSEWLWHSTAYRRVPWRAAWAVTDHERLRLRCSVDALAAHQYHLNAEELLFILRDCAGPKGSPMNSAAKGFWRVDQEKEPELRHTILTLVAFHDLDEHIRRCGGETEEGMGAFCSQNAGEGWLIPENLRLRDYGLGHDARADRPQPVASSLGPRFYEWQLDEDPEESWLECELHARNLQGHPGRSKPAQSEDSKIVPEGSRTTEVPANQKSLSFAPRADPATVPTASKKRS